MSISSEQDNTLKELFPTSDLYHIRMSLLLATLKRRAERLVEEVTSNTSDLVVRNEIKLVREAIDEIEAELNKKVLE